MLILCVATTTVAFAENVEPNKIKYDFDFDTEEWLVLEPDTPTGTAYIVTDHHGGWWVDAEKIPGSDGVGNPAPNNPGDEDDLLCWAATVANMVDYAGWGFVGGMNDADEYLDHFEDHVTDYGSLTEYGLEYWFDGTLPTHAGDWATIDVAGGGDFWDPIGILSLGFNHELTWDSTQTLASIDTWLRAGYPCGLGIYPNTPPGGHAITCWGFNYDASDPDYYVGIWVTDSDSHKHLADAPDSLAYYEVEYVEYEAGKFRWEMPNYGSGWHISSVNALHSYPTNRPTAVSNGAYFADEGSPVTFDAAGSSDPDGDALQYHWNIEDAWTGWAGSSSVNWMWDDDYTGDLYVQVTDGHLKDTAHTTVTINNVAPTVDAGTDQLSDEGATVSFSGGFTDPGLLDDHTIVWDFGDSSPTVSGTLTPTHVYEEDGVYTVTLTVTDDDGGVGSNTLIVTVANVAPTLDPINDQTVDEADTVTLSGSFTDPGVLDTHTATVNWGEGTVEALTVVESGGSGTVSGSHVYGDNGVYAVTVTVTDDEGASDTEALTVTVNNVAPAITPFGPFTMDEGGTVTINADASDPGSDDLTYDWTFEHGSAITNIHYNDGTSPDTYPSPGPTYPFQATDTVSQTYGDDSVYSVTLTVTDDDGGAATYTTTLTVNNVNPTITATDLALPYPDNPDFILPVVHQLDFTATASDPGSEDLTFTWNWGDATSESETYYNFDSLPDPYPSPDGTYPYTATDTASHTYAEPGTYTVTVTITDDDTGVSDSASWSIKVLTPEEAKHDINDYIQGLPDEYLIHKPANRKNAIDNMFRALDRMLDNEAYTGFMHGLVHNVRSKCDGSVDGKANNDWVIDEYAQWHICSKIDDLVAYIQTLY